MAGCPPIAVLPGEAAELEADLDAGPIIDDQGFRQLNEVFVEKVGGLKISVFSDEHPPPHFRVDYQGESANFQITTGVRLPGQKGLVRYDRNIHQWWKNNKLLIAQAWNRVRPSNCTVGTVDTAALGWETTTCPKDKR